MKTKAPEKFSLPAFVINQEGRHAHRPPDCLSYNAWNREAPVAVTGAAANPAHTHIIRCAGRETGHCDRARLRGGGHRLPMVASRLPES